jgi:hypothetical protein
MLNASDIRTLQPLDFNNSIVDLGTPEIARILGLGAILDGEGPHMLPFRNMAVDVDSRAQTTQLLQGLINKIVDLEQDRIELSLGTFSFTGSQIVNGVLPFTALSGLSRPPANAGQFIVLKSGLPISSGDPYTRAGDATLIPGTGVRFAQSWASDENGILWVFTGRTGEMIKFYEYYASSFTGSGYRSIHLNALGSDIKGKSISPLPTLSSQVKVIDATFKTEGTSYSVSGFGTSDPVITLNYDAEPDQIFTFLIVG